MLAPMVIWLLLCLFLYYLFINLSYLIFRILLKSGSDVNLPIALTDFEIRNLKPMEEAHCNGSGALIEAACIGHIELVLLLFQHGALDYDNKALVIAITVIFFY